MKITNMLRNTLNYENSQNQKSKSTKMKKKTKKTDRNRNVVNFCLDRFDVDRHLFFLFIPKDLKNVFHKISLKSFNFYAWT